MMQTHARRSAVLVLVLVALAALGLVRLSAQAPTQGPAAAVAAAPAPPPAPPDVAAIPADAQKSGSGLAWKVLKPGTGTAHPARTDKVTVNYNGWTTNGRIFDSTEMRRKPSEFIVGNVLPGMSEGIQLMTVGEKRRFWMPENLAFKSAPGKPQGMCVFEIELLDVQAPAGEFGKSTPPDVAAPPADAQKTKSGLASKVVKAGTGTRHPTASDTVTVHYSGWTTDGKMFDSSFMRGAPAQFPLNRVIPGWTEGVQLMVEGEQRRFWIPGKLAYDNIDQPGAPKGMLVFDVELIKIQ
jgi:peptidylprolyl isomerase